jgi:nucleotide-binding universal stress UspA family protein
MAKTNSKTSIELAGSVSKTEELSYRRILVPLDFDDRSIRALRDAIPLAMRSGGKLVLLHVVQFPIMPMPAVTGGSMGQVMEAHKTLRLEAKARLDELARKTGKPGLITHKLVTVGITWNEIVKAAKRLKCDLIVISTHGHSGIMRLLSSHTVEHVVRMAACPVLCVRG